MWMYLLKFSACLIILLLFYKLVLEKVPIHHFKRYFLLAAFIIALGIPLITFTQYVTVMAQPLASPLILEPNFFHQAATADNTSVVPIILWSTYGLGVVAFTIKFLLNLKSIISSIRNNPKQRSGKLLHVLLQEKVAPHTFFNYLFFNIKNYKTHKIPQEVFWHEETHAKQKHSLDLLLLELLQIIFWFHPLIYWAKHLVKLNHEFLADQAVLNKGAVIPAYQNLVLAFSSSDSYRNAIVPSLANAIHYSSIKKRIIIMKTKTTKKAIWLKSLLILPLIALLLYGFTSTEILEKTVLIHIEQRSSSQDNPLGASETMMQEYRNFTDNLQKSETQIIKMPEYQRIEAINELMTDEQRASVANYRDIVKIPNVNLTKTKSIKPSASQFKSWKDSENFAIWIDGKHISNTVLDKYSFDDIVHFTSSFIYDNARSEKFPQPYQNHLFTKSGYEETYSKHTINKYTDLNNRYAEEIKSFNKKEQPDNSELRILKVRLDQLYNGFSMDELKKYNIAPPEAVPNKIGSKPVKNQKAATFKMVSENSSSFKNLEGQAIDQKGPAKINILINRYNQLLINEDLITVDKLPTAIQELQKAYKSNGKEISFVSLTTDLLTPQKTVDEVIEIIEKQGLTVKASKRNPI